MHSKVAIIIPSHNSEKHITDTVRQLERETEGLDCKILVVANGCTDNTVTILKQLGNDIPRLEVLVLDLASKMNAMNKGAEFCKNYELIAFMDDDCRIDKEAILACLKTHTIHKNLHAVALTPKAVITESNILGRFWQKVFSQSTESTFLLEPKKYMVGRFMMFKTVYWKDIPLNLIADDAWLSRYHWPYIKILNNQYVHYKPSSSVKEWWKRYSRTVACLEQMKELFPAEKFKVAFKTRKNWCKLFNPLYFPNNIYFVIYRAIRKANKAYYKKQLRDRKFDSTWYRDKTSFFE